MDLTGLGLGKLPLEVTESTQLESLDLSFNNLQEIPEEIGRLNNLKRLVINRESQFVSIENDPGNIPPKNLYEYFISLKVNTISKLPQSIIQL